MTTNFLDYESIADPAINIVEVDTTLSDADSTTYTFTDHDIGEAAADRIVLVAITGGAVSTRIINSVTIGGNAATIIDQDTAGTGGVCGFAGLLVPAGTDATIVVTFNNAMLRAGITVFRMTGRSTVVAHDTGKDTVTQTLSDSLDVPENGAAVAVAYGVRSSSDPMNFDWTGGSLPEIYEENYAELVRASHSVASADFSDEQIGMTVEAAADGPVSASVNILVMASFGL